MPRVFSEEDFAPSPRRVFSDSDFAPDIVEERPEPSLWDRVSNASVSDVASGVGAAGLKGLNALTLGFGDEVVAGGNALLDALQGDSIGSAYDKRLAEARSLNKLATESAPIASVATDILGGAVNPALAFKSVSGLRGIGSAALKNAGAGAVQGFGEGEGLTDRISNALTTGGVSGVLGGAFDAVGKGVGSVADFFTNEGRNLIGSGIGITRGDITRSRKFGGKLNTDESPLYKALDEAIDDGLLKGDVSPQGLVDKNVDAITDYSSQVKNFIRGIEGDDTGKVFDNQFPEAQKFLEENGAAGDLSKLKEQYNRVTNDLVSKWDGTLESLQREKQKLQAKGYKNTTDSADLDKAIARDLKLQIEASAGENGEAVRELNRKTGVRLTLQDVLNKARDAEDASGVLSTILKKGSLPLGGIALSQITDNPLYAAGGIGLAAGNTQRGRLILGSLLRKSGSGIESGLESLATTGSIAPSGASLLSSLLSDEDIPSLVSEADASMLPPGLSANEVLNMSERIKEDSPLTETNQRPTFKYGGKEYQKFSKEEALSLLDGEDPLVRAIARTESANKPDAVSRVGALGLMQLMPANIKYFKVENPFDPRESIRASKELMKEEMDRFKDEKLAIAAYNAGSPAVRRAMAKAGSSKYENIRPYLPKETQDYVVKVLKAKQEFSEA